MGPLSRAVAACRPVGDSDSSADCPRGASQAIFALAAGEARSQRRHGPSVRAVYRLINSWMRGEALIQITGTIALHEREIEERFVHASGPGGQNVNKVATAVELRFDVGVSSLPPDVKARLTVLAGSRMTTDGVLVIDSREHRTQGQNREAARARLVALIQKAAIRPRKRRPTKPGRTAKERRLAAKKRRADVKGMRGRPRVNED